MGIIEIGFQDWVWMDVAGCSGEWRDLTNSGTFYERAVLII